MREMEDDLLDYRRTREWICEILEEVIVLAKVDIIRVLIFNDRGENQLSGTRGTGSNS